jgi:hypothetical protein
MKTYRLDLENTYQKRNEALKQREHNIEEMLNQKKSIQEQELFFQRQNLIEEIKQLREKEATFKQSIEASLKLNQIDSTKYDKINEELKNKELKFKQKEENFEKLLQNEKEKIKIDLDRVYGHREFLLQSLESKNKQDAQYNEIERANLDRIKHEHNTSQLRISDLELQIQKLSGENLCLKTENELIKDKLNRCLDYDFLKQENKMLKYKLDISKEIIGEKSFSIRKSTTPKQSSIIDQVFKKIINN